MELKSRAISPSSSLRETENWRRQVALGDAANGGRKGQDGPGDGIGGDETDDHDDDDRDDDGDEKRPFQVHAQLHGRGDGPLFFQFDDEAPVEEGEVSVRAHHSYAGRVRVHVDARFALADREGRPGRERLAHVGDGRSGGDGRSRRIDQVDGGVLTPVQLVDALKDLVEPDAAPTTPAISPSL